MKGSRSVVAAAVGVCALLPLLLTTPSSGGETLHHELSVVLDPQAQRLQAEDVLTVPDILFPGGGSVLHFSLHEGLAPSSPTSGVVLRRTGSRGTDPTVETFAAELPSGLRSFTLVYGGVIDHPLEEVGREYARGQRQTPGRIFDEGAYLSPRSSWYPAFGDTLFSFGLSVHLPAAWDAVSQGRRTLHTVDGAMYREYPLEKGKPWCSCARQTPGWRRNISMLRGSTSKWTAS